MGLDVNTWPDPEPEPDQDPEPLNHSSITWKQKLGQQNKCSEPQSVNLKSTLSLQIPAVLFEKINGSLENSALNFKCATTWL